MHMTKCPACSEPVVASGRGRPPLWCSGRCRRWVSGLGGPRGAASWKRSTAQSWRNFGTWGNPDAFKFAEQLESEAAALEALDAPATVAAASPRDGRDE